MSKKVDNVRVEKNILLKEKFKNKGLPEILSGINFSINTHLMTSEGVLREFIKAVKKEFKKEFFSSDKKTRMNYFKNINIFGNYSVEISKFDRSENEEFFDYMERLLLHCRPKKDKDQYNSVTPVKVTLRSGENTTVGYSILDGEIVPAHHRTTRAFSNNKRFGYNLILDLPTLIAETVVVQSLHKYAHNNRELIQYLFVKKNFTSKLADFAITPRIPTSEEFKKDYMDVVNKNRFEYTEVVESNAVEKQKDTFYLVKKELGHGPKFLINDYLSILAVEDFVRESNYAIYKANEEAMNRSGYARAPQSKKGTKKSHLDKMANNIFLSRFGFVELDNDVDLKKFEIIEENFKELIEKIHIPYRKDYTFRIKKLGKHRAAGAFFPYYKTTIFDLSHPEVFIHEFGHQIDFMIAENMREDYYSETLEFRPIFDQYKQLVMNHVSNLADNHVFKQLWNGKTKYNSHYYLKPTEVFARCYEIYMSSKDIDNSLLRTAEELKREHVYPFDEAFVQNILSFFDELLEKIAVMYPNKKALKKVEHVASPIYSEMETDDLNFEQLNIFDF